MFWSLADATTSASPVLRFASARLPRFGCGGDTFAMLQMIADMWYSVAMAHQGVRRKHKRKDYMTFGAAHNKPLTVTQVDGTQTVVPALSRKQLHTIIRKGHNSR